MNWSLRAVSRGAQTRPTRNERRVTPRWRTLWTGTVYQWSQRASKTATDSSSRTRGGSPSFCKCRVVGVETVVSQHVLVIRKWSNLITWSQQYIFRHLRHLHANEIFILVWSKCLLSTEKRGVCLCAVTHFYHLKLVEMSWNSSSKELIYIQF